MLTAAGLLRLALVAWALSAMGYLAPGRDHAVLAEAVADAVIDGGPLFRGDNALTHTMALVVAVAFREGSLRPAVVGDVRGGRPHSFCTMQIHDSSGGTPALAEDPRACIATGLAMLRQSLRVCPAYPVAFYAEGPRGCSSARAQRISNDRMNLAAALVRHAREERQIEP